MCNFHISSWWFYMTMSRLTYSLILISLSEAINESVNYMPRLWVSLHSHVIHWTTHAKKLTTTLWVTKPFRAAAYITFHTQNCPILTSTPIVYAGKAAHTLWDFHWKKETFPSAPVQMASSWLSQELQVSASMDFTCTLVNRHNVATSRYPAIHNTRANTALQPLEVDTQEFLLTLPWDINAIPP
jgi:hypothetical protein